MIRAVLDTNVLISSLLKPTSVPARIREAWEDRLSVLCLSKDLFRELVEVLDRPKIKKATRVSESEITAFLRSVPKAADFFVGAIPQVNAIAEDPDDDIVIATALATNANVIVSGDQHLLNLGDYDGIPMMTPRSFLQLLEAEWLP